MVSRGYPNLLHCSKTAFKSRTASGMGVGCWKMVVSCVYCQRVCGHSEGQGQQGARRPMKSVFLPSPEFGAGHSQHLTGKCK